MSSHLTPSEDAALRRVVVIGELPADRERLTAALAHLGVTVHEDETLEALAERLRATEPAPLPLDLPDPLFSPLAPGPTPNRAMRRRAARAARRGGGR